MSATLLLLAALGMVIPAGQEPLISAMCGDAEVLPGDCRLQDVQVDGAAARAHYRCKNADALLELRHVSQPHGAVATTGQFALVPVQGGSQALFDAVAQRVRAQEKRFVWADFGTPVATPPHGIPPPPSPFWAALLALLRHVGIAHAGPWLVLLALSTALGPLRRTPRADRIAAAGVFALALIGRVTLGAWGPLHVNGQGPLWILHALHSGGFLGDYGPGYGELFGGLAQLSPQHADLAVLGANVVWSSLVPVAAYGLGRSAGLSIVASLFGGLLLAADPVAIHAAPTESYFPAILALTALSGLALAQAALHAGQGQRRMAGGLTLSAVLLAAEAARVHPAAWIPVALVPLACLLPAGTSPRRRGAWTLLAFGGVGLTVALLDGSSLASVARATTHWAHLSGSIRTTWLLPGAIAATLLALGLAQHRAVVLVGVLHVSALLATRDNYMQGDEWQACFYRLYLTLPAVAGAALIAAPRFRRVLGAGLVAALLALLYRPVPLPSTEQLEFTWMKAAFLRLPANCHIAHVFRSGERVVALPVWAAGPGMERPVDATALGATAFDLSLGRCVVYAHSSLCSTPEGHAACDLSESRLILEPLASVRLPARAQSEAVPYQRRDVPLWLARVRAARPGAP